MRPLLFSLLFALLLSTVPSGYEHATGANLYSPLEPLQQDNVATIETYAKGLDSYTKRNARAARYFADTASYEQQNAPARWQEFKTRKALDDAWQNGKTYSSSNVWFNQTGELVVALFTFSSPSGDWAQYLTNYYRKDGTLAKSNAELRTFMGDIIRITNRFYASSGKVLKEQTRFLDLQTRKPKRVNKDQFMDMEVPLYARTSALPFYGLVKKR